MEELAKLVTVYLSHAVEIFAAVIIGIALLKTALGYRSIFQQSTEKKEALRIQFGSSVAVALELLLGADVLATAVAPSWDAIGKLAAIAVLRTALNYFLEKELNPKRIPADTTPVTGEVMAETRYPKQQLHSS